MEFNVRVQPKAGRNSVEIDDDRVTARVTAAQLGYGFLARTQALLICRGIFDFPTAQLDIF